MAVDKNNIERLLRDAVVSLSLPASEQCRVTAPGCVACELLNDFDHACKCYARSCLDRLFPERSQVLADIDNAMALMSEPDYVCFEASVLNRPVWGTLRDLAAQAMLLFDWQDHVVSPHQKTESGVWQRPDGTSTIVVGKDDGVTVHNRL